MRGGIANEKKRARIAGDNGAGKKEGDQIKQAIQRSSAIRKILRELIRVPQNQEA